MPSSSHNKVNPFELDYDGEDDGYDWNVGDEWPQDQIAGEDQRLMEEYNNERSAPNSSYYHSDRQRRPQRAIDNTLGKRTFSSYHNHHGSYGSDGGNIVLHHKPQLWKFGVLATVLVMALVIWNDTDMGDDDEYVSMIDEIPNDDYRLIILGERHSGTAWLQARLHECFPRASVLLSLQRPGFLFQEEPKDDHQSNSIVIHLTLNVYDWLEQMRMSPEYAPNHVGVHKEGHVIPLPWDEFLDKPWTMDRPERDAPLHNITNPPCQLGFQYDQVVSCAEKPPGGPDNPIYELNPENGNPFESILHLRAAKLRNHQSVQEWKSVQNFWTLSYENVGKEFKSRLLAGIQEFAGWSPTCSGDVLPPLRERRGDMSIQYVEYVTKHVDWKAEELVSYEPWSLSDTKERGIQMGSEDVKHEEISMPTIAPTVAATTPKPSKSKTADKETETTKEAAGSSEGSNEEKTKNENYKTTEKKEKEADKTKTDTPEKKVTSEKKSSDGGKAGTEGVESDDVEVTKAEEKETDESKSEADHSNAASEDGTDNDRILL